MEQQSSTSKVTVEYFDPHDVFKLLAPGLIPRLPLRNLHWQSHSGPLRSISSLHIDLVRAGDAPAASTPAHRPSDSGVRDDGFQTQHLGGRAGSTETVDTQSVASGPTGTQRRHQIPGLRRTPYLKVLLVRCDDNDSYKSSVRSEIREWIKANTPPSSPKKRSNQENHDAFEWMILHVVIPNTVAATQPRTSSKSEVGAGTAEKSSSSRWRSGSTPLMEKLRSDFNGSSKSAPDRVAQVRIGINDVPYDVLPRVVPAMPSGYSESEQDADAAWKDLLAKLKTLILLSFDLRVSQYEDDIKERDAQRTLPGWNFCTFFILKEGLARGFENVGLVEDALVGYDELSVGLDSVLHEQAESGSPESHGGALLSFTEELKLLAEKTLAEVSGAAGDDEEAVDLQSKETSNDQFDEIPIAATKKAYRDMILANKVSVFDFRCYIFSRQVALLLRLGNASSTREELLAKLKEQQDSVLHGVAPMAPPSPKPTEEPENLVNLADICKRTLQFIPSISQVMRQDVTSALGSSAGVPTQVFMEALDNIIAAFAYSVAQQILAETSTKALPIPPSTLPPSGEAEQKAAIPEPKTMMHPARSSSLRVRPSSRPPPSPGIFPGPGRRASASDGDGLNAQFAKTGLDDLAARRGDLYMLSRAVLEGLGKKRGWSNGWAEAPIVGEVDIAHMEEISLDDGPSETQKPNLSPIAPFVAGIESHLLRTATDNSDDFYRLYEILSDKALRHYTVANYEHAVQASRADLAVLKIHQKEYRAAVVFFSQTTPFFGENGWSLLELSMLVMYSQCLSQLQSKEDYVRVALKLLTKSCTAEKERLNANLARSRTGHLNEFPDTGPVVGVVGKLFDVAKSLPYEAKVPLSNFFTAVELMGSPEYHEGRDSCSLTIGLRSLLPEDITVNLVVLRVSSTEGGPSKDLRFEKKGDVVITPGKNIVTVSCNTVVPGKYDIDQLGLRSNNLFLDFERDATQPIASTADIFKRPQVVLFQRGGALDVQVAAAKDTTLDKDNSLDLTLSTGWNSLKSCELRVKPATGGLRLLTTEAKIVSPSMDFAKPPEVGIFYFGPVAAQTSVTLRFPYSVEQAVDDVMAKLEVTYVTESGDSFALAKSLAVPVSLALGVNVQDVFKQQALFSRFNVSTANGGPLRLYKSELLDSDLFESAFSIPPANTITVFPKQPATLLYKISRKPGAKSGKRTGRTMHLRLHYSVLQAEVEGAVVASVKEALEGTPLARYSRPVLASVLKEVRAGLQPHDLERAALLGEVTTSFLVGVSWEKHVVGFGSVPETGEDAAAKLSRLLREWQKSHARVPVAASDASQRNSILIPVEIPSVSVVHTADIRLQDPFPGLVEETSGGTRTARLNQMIPATLHLKWTRAWDTETPRREDQEFSYEVTAQTDMWLLGGRRRGHFVIPGSSSSPAGETVASTPETEAEIPLMMMPLREGWLPYPAVEIKEVPPDGGSGEDGAAAEAAAAAAAAAAPACEVDWRNLGETVRVAGARQGVTVSLDASGVGGGPLVLGSEDMRGLQGRVVR